MRAADLPTDQLALLSLLLRRGQRPAQIATVLGIDAEAVRARARAAVLALAPAGPEGLDAQQRERLADLLLGFQDEAQRLVTFEALCACEPLRALAMQLAAALAELSSAPRALLEALQGTPTPASEPVAVAAPASSPPPGQRQSTTPGAPTLPAGPDGAGAAARAPERRRRSAAAEAAAARLHGARAGGLDRLAGLRAHLPGGALPRGRSRPDSSRLGGALLLISIIGALIAALALSGALGSSGGSLPAPGARASASNAAAKSGSSAAGGAGEAHPEALIKLTSPSGGGARGEAVVARVGSALDIALEAHGLAPSKSATYIVWLYNSPSSFVAVGRTPAIESDGRLPGSASSLPEGAARYHKLIVTRESTSLPTHPGEIVLEGKLSVGSAGGGR